MDLEGGGVGVEGFVIDLAGRFTVERVGDLGAELGEVEVVHAGGDFFVGAEAETNFTVGDFGME